jgi:hypothetical protein
MAANTRARASLRARLAVETLEGRAMPATMLIPPSIDPQHLAVQFANPAAIPVIARIFVNGERVVSVNGKPTFAGIGSAASGDQNGQSESGGTTIFVNGRAVGTFEGPPRITRTIATVTNGHGQLVRVLSYHIAGTPYLPPSSAARIVWHAAAISGVCLE